jgi:hypothetical protein
MATRDELLSLWPTTVNSDDCLQSDAEAMAESVFFAVHQNMQFEKEGSVLCGEQELLDDLLVSNVKDGLVFLPITGATGVGKSHVIKWLHRKLLQLDDGVARHVVRIPKGLSLKSVLVRILQDLEGEKYDVFRQQLDSAAEQLDPVLIARLLIAHLTSTLETESEAAKFRLGSDGRSDDPDLDKQIETWGNRRFLPALLQDPFAQDVHFFSGSEHSGIIDQLVEQVTYDSSSEEDERKHNFVPDDLRLPQLDPRELSGPARKCWKVLDTESDEHRVNAVRVLNSVLDTAKNALLNLNTYSLGELFEDVRKALLEDGKELILLIEDFAVLSGMQRALLDQIIKQAGDDGADERCLMRTVLAYTDGYSMPATALSRATSTWRISELATTDNELLHRTKNLIGSYLNAARIGRQTLDSLFAESEKSTVSSDWVPVFGNDTLNEKTRNLADVFGTTDAGYFLFPFNDNAIEKLLEDSSHNEQRKLVFNPRQIIKKVIRPVIDFRNHYEQSRFPPRTLGKQSLRDAVIIDEINKRTEASNRTQYLKLFAYWGGQPTTLQEVSSLPSEIIEGLGLSTLDLGGGSKEVQPPPTDLPLPKAPGPQTPIDPETSEKDDPYLFDWKNELENWANGRAMEQGKANQLRNVIANAVLNSLPPDWPRMRPKSFEPFQWVYIPNAAGQGNLTDPDLAMIAVCTAEELGDPEKNAEIQLMLLEVLRYTGAKSRTIRDWPTTNSHEASGLYTAFIEKYRERALKWLNARYLDSSHEGDGSFALVPGLLIGAIVTNPGNVTFKNKTSIVNALFLENNESNVEASGEWGESLNHLYQIRSGDNSWIKQLKKYAGYRQGTGDACHAIDPTLLTDAINWTTSNWSFPDDRPSNSKLKEVVNLNIKLRKTFPIHAQNRASHLTTWKEEMIGWLGPINDIDQTQFNQRLGELLTRLRKFSPNSIVEQIEQIRRTRTKLSECQIKSELKNAALIDNESFDGQFLSQIAKSRELEIEVTSLLKTQIDRLFADFSQHIETKITTLGGDVITELSVKVGSELSQLGTSIDEYEEMRR